MSSPTVPPLAVEMVLAAVNKAVADLAETPGQPPATPAKQGTNVDINQPPASTQAVQGTPYGRRANALQGVTGTDESIVGRFADTVQSDPRRPQQPQQQPQQQQQGPSAGRQLYSGASRTDASVSPAVTQPAATPTVQAAYPHPPGPVTPYDPRAPPQQYQPPHFHPGRGPPPPPPPHGYDDFGPPPPRRRARSRSRDHRDDDGRRDSGNGRRDSGNGRPRSNSRGVRRFSRDYDDRDRDSPHRRDRSGDDYQRYPSRDRDYENDRYYSHEGARDDGRYYQPGPVGAQPAPHRASLGGAAPRAPVQQQGYTVQPVGGAPPPPRGNWGQPPPPPPPVDSQQYYDSRGSDYYARRDYDYEDRRTSGGGRGRDRDRDRGRRDNDRDRRDDRNESGYVVERRRRRASSVGGGRRRSNSNAARRESGSYQARRESANYGRDGRDYNSARNYRADSVSQRPHPYGNPPPGYDYGGAYPRDSYAPSPHSPIGTGGPNGQLHPGDASTGGLPYRVVSASSPINRAGDASLSPQPIVSGGGAFPNEPLGHVREQPRDKWSSTEGSVVHAFPRRGRPLEPDPQPPVAAQPVTGYGVPIAQGTAVNGGRGAQYYQDFSYGSNQYQNAPYGEYGGEYRESSRSPRPRHRGRSTSQQGRRRRHHSSSGRPRRRSGSLRGRHHHHHHDRYEDDYDTRY